MSQNDDMFSLRLNAISSLQYESQHFGFHPRNFLDSAYNVFCENLSAGLTEMKHCLINEFKQTIPPFVIMKQTDNFLQELLKELDRCIDKLEVFSNRNVFSIDSHVILPEDEVHIKNPCTKEDEEKLDTEIEELKQKILIEKAKRFSLKKKISEQKEVKAALLSLLNQLRCLLANANQEGVTSENAQSLLIDLMKLINVNVHPSPETDIKVE